MLINELEQNTVSIDLGFFSSQEKNFKSRKYRATVETKLLHMCVYIFITIIMIYKRL